MRIKEIKISGEIVTNAVVIKQQAGRGLKVDFHRTKIRVSTATIKKGSVKQREMAAQEIQKFLDGYVGTGSDIWEYDQMLERMQ